MNDFVESVIASVVANVLTGLVSLLSSPNEIRARKHSIHPSNDLGYSGTIDSTLQQVVTSLAKKIDGIVEIADSVSRDRIRIFLVSPEVESFVRQIYAIHIARGGARQLDSLKETFRNSLAIQTRLSEPSLGKASEALFDALKAACDRAISLAIDQGVLSAHEGQSLARHRVILDELACIHKQLDIYRHKDVYDVPAIVEFEGLYRKIVAQRHGFIIPPTFDAARRIPIDDIFVPTNIVRRPCGNNEEPVSLDLQAFLKSFHRGVLLGNPGAGKSTTAAKITYDLALRYSERLLSARELTPVLVILRDFGGDRKSRQASILDHIHATANSKYQLRPPSHAFDYSIFHMT